MVILKTFSVKPVIRKIPVFGALVDVRIRNHTEAFVEVVSNIGLSMVPVWLGAIIMLADKNRNYDLFGLIVRNVYKGELFIYATALLGPLYYFIFKEYRDFPKFPGARFFMLSSVFILIISASLFSVQRTESFAVGLDLDHDYLFFLSWIVYFYSVFVVYLAYVYKNFAETSAAHVSGTTTRDFVHDYIERRGGLDGED